MGTGSDEEVCEKVCGVIRNEDPKLLFVQFDSVDGAGHRYTYGTKPYLDTITYIDSLLGKIFNTAEECGKVENTLFIVTADHGGYKTNHGGSTDDEKLISYFVRGKSVNKGEFGYCEIRDTAAITAFALGFEQPACWSSRLPDSLFADGFSFERPSEVAADGSKRYSDRQNQPTSAAPGKTIRDFARWDGMRCYFPFDNDAEDKTGKTTADVEGKLYYTKGFYGSAATFDDAAIRCSAVNAGTDYYTIAVWIRKDFAGGSEKMNIFFTKENENDVGLSFFIQGDELIHEIGMGDGNIHYAHPLPGNYAGNWFHFICSYDRNENELCYYYDFALETDWYSEVEVPRELKLDGNKVTIGGNASLSLDDLIVFDHKLSDPEIDDLQRYYEQ